jgi:type I restriction enzyme S subunit
MPNLNTNIIRGIPFEYPPLDGQRRIAAILDKADALRRKRKRALDLFGSLNRSIFLEVAETAGEAKSRLGDLAEVLGGKRLPKGHDYCEEETGYKYLRVADIQKDNLRRLDLKNLKVESFAAISRYVVDEGNVVITIAGTIGATRYIDSELAGVNLTENAAKIVLRFPERVDPIYLTHALQSDEVQKQIRASTGQVTIGKLALFRIEALELPLPSVSAQRRFSRFVTESRRVRDVLIKSANMTDSLFSSLQSRAFSGQL